MDVSLAERHLHGLSYDVVVVPAFGIDPVTLSDPSGNWVVTGPFRGMRSGWVWGRQLADCAGIVAPQNLHFTGFLFWSEETI